MDSVTRKLISAKLQSASLSFGMAAKAFELEMDKQGIADIQEGLALMRDTADLFVTKKADVA